MKRAMPIVLAAIVMGGAAAGQNRLPNIAEETLDNTKAASAVRNKYIAMVKKPITPAELLQNIKFAIDHDLFLREDFFVPEVAEHFGGGTHVSWLINRPTEKRFTVLGIDNLYELSNTYRANGIYLTYQTVDEHGDEALQGKGQGRLTFIPSQDSRYTVELVESVFGSNPEVSNPYANDNPQHPRTIGPTTHKLGNKLLQYRVNRQDLNGYAAFITNGNGNLAQLNIHEGEQ